MCREKKYVAIRDNIYDGSHQYSVNPTAQDLSPSFFTAGLLISLDEMLQWKGYMN